jgi:hypothetical protein
MHLASKLALGAGILLVAIQIVRFERTNPPVKADLLAPPDVKSALRRACYDCHSNEATWPWYTAIAPASWLAHYDVTAGRSAVNFSEWGTLSPEEQGKKSQETVESIAEGEMPPWYYVVMHPQAHLTPAERAAIVVWAGPSKEERSKVER